MKKILTLVAALSLVASLAVGGSIAYLQDSDEAVNTMTLGNVDIEQTETDRDGNQFEQNQPMFPIIGDEADTDNDGYWDNNNVIDKTVTVINTGSSSAYVRTLYAFEIGTMDEKYLNINWESGIDPQRLGTTTINGETYVIYAVTYSDALAPDASVTGLKQVALDYTAGNDEVKAVSGDSVYQILVVSQAVQVEGFGNAVTALNEGFGTIASATDAAEFFGDIGASGPAGDSDAFEDALGANTSTITINLTGDVNYDLAAWQNNAMGGENTKSITINGNGHKITFDETNSDWNNVVTNGAKLILNDVTIDKGLDKGNNAWNSFGLKFNCDVEMNNVTINHSTILGKNATLNNVTISHENAGTSEYYGLMITAEGQIVNIDGLTINGSRGIKVIDENVSNPQKITLNVSNADFNTPGSKAAFLVTTTAGADINLSNIDISGVAADPKHEVWVDEDREAQYDLVTVTGGTKILEGTFKSPVAGLYQEGNTYYVSTADGMQYFNAKALTGNNSTAETATIELEADIDMKGAEFSAIITQRGDTLIFKGNGHTISNVKVVSGENDNTTGQASMFYAYQNSTLEVTDLTLDNITVTSDAEDSGYAAAVIGYCEGTARLTNVDVTNASVVGVKSSGMLVGHLSGTLVASNCDLSGTVKLDEFSGESEGHYAGKYIGTIAGAAQLSYCSADVTVSGSLKESNNGDIYGRNLGTLN